MITPQSNISLEGLARIIESKESFILSGHVSPDGDCVGSQLALWHALKAMGKKATCLEIKSGTIDEGLRFLPGADEFIAIADYDGAADVFIACDVPNLERLGDAAKVQKLCSTTITIDHHASPTTMSDYTYTDPDIASTTMIVWKLIKALPVSLSQEMALCAYTGLLTDTGGFRFQNTDDSSFTAASEMVSLGVNPSFVAEQVFGSRSIASLNLEAVMISRLIFGTDQSFVLSYITQEDLGRYGATKLDTEPLVSILRSIRGIRVACILREEVGSVRGSLRAKEDSDVSQIARHFGGGGHKAAAGFTYKGSLEDALKDVKQVLINSLVSLRGAEDPSSELLEDSDLTENR